MKIRTKLGLTYFIFSFLLLTFVSTFYYIYTKNILEKDALDHLRSVSAIQQHRIEDIVEQNLERIRLVSSRTQLRISLNNYLKSHNKNHLEKIRLILDDAISSVSSFDVISILDAQGNAITSSLSQRVGTSYSSSDFFEDAMKRNTAEYFFLDSDDQIKVYLAGPLTYDNRVIGMLLIESDVNNMISSLTDYSGLGETGETVLGKRNPKTDNVDFLAPLRFDKYAALRHHVPFSNTNTPIVNAILNKSQVYTEATDYRNQDVLAVTRYINQTGWGLVVKIDKEEAFSPIANFVTYLIIVISGVLFIVILVSYVLTNIISKPLVELASDAQRISQGDLTHRASLKSHDEIGLLAAMFNNMTNNLITTQQNLKNSNRALQEHRDHLEELVLKRTKELEVINAELESFAYSVSHDLRSPLRSIEGFSHILKEKYVDVLDEKGIVTFQRICDATERMGRLIDDILNLSRVNRGTFHKNMVNLTNLAKFTLSELEPSPEEINAEIYIHDNLFVYADESLMQVLVDNLISNAWKYSLKNECIKIEFGVQINDQEKVFFVKDNGIGFDMAYYKKLFNPFQRLVSEEEYEGTGIGLATAARVIQRHNGKIWAESQPGKGATFFFTIPDLAKS